MEQTILPTFTAEFSAALDPTKLMHAVGHVVPFRDGVSLFVLSIKETDASAPQVAPQVELQFANDAAAFVEYVKLDDPANEVHSIHVYAPSPDPEINAAAARAAEAWIDVTAESESETDERVFARAMQHARKLSVV